MEALWAMLACSGFGSNGMRAMAMAGLWLMHATEHCCVLDCVSSKIMREILLSLSMEQSYVCGALVHGEH